jgi:hypothetical protein
MSNLDPTVAAAISMIAAAVSTAILRYAAYRWPTGYHKKSKGMTLNETKERNDEAPDE